MCEKLNRRAVLAGRAGLGEERLLREVVTRTGSEDEGKEESGREFLSGPQGSLSLRRGNTQLSTQ